MDKWCVQINSSSPHVYIQNYFIYSNKSRHICRFNVSRDWQFWHSVGIVSHVGLVYKLKDIYNNLVGNCQLLRCTCSNGLRIK